MILSPETTTLGFIGTGVMGASMAGHLMAAGYKVNVYTRTRAKAQVLLDKGARWQGTPQALAAASQVVFSIVGFPKDVEEVYFGDNGIFKGINSGSCVVDMTTSSPELAVRISSAAAQKGAMALDAPVSGGDIGAREARLSIMVGGSQQAFDTVLPLFEIMGKNIVYQGKAGSGQHTKMCNQIAIASGMLGVCEALAYAQKSGLDAETVLKSISGGAAASWLLSTLGPCMIAGNFDPGFFVKHFIKDMGIALESSQAIGLEAPGLKLAKARYDELAGKGGENDGTQGLFKLYM